MGRLVFGEVVIERENRNQLVEMNRKKRGKLLKQQYEESMVSPLSPSRRPKPVQCLSPTDQVILSNIFHAYENTCIATKNAQFPYYPLVPHTTIHGILNEFTCLFRISVAYLTHIPEFQCRSMHDKVRLVKNHFGIISNINASLMHPLPHNNLIVTWRNLFGLDITQRLLKRNDALQQYIHDPILLKIVLIVLVLSSGISRSVDGLDVNEDYTDPLCMLNSQNVYVELLWRYILLRCGNEKDTVKFVTNLIVFILQFQVLGIDMDEYISKQQSEIEQMTPLMQTMWPTTDETDSVDKNDTWQNPIS
ncbi:hypothetical protein I4U23_008702 [Adineta vaga]|nr:hypothetical protein I4U23_008702 [Adineta vaga]